jgi:hypothetical protein
MVVHVAREAVRAAAVTDHDPDAAADRAARNASGLDDGRLDVRTVVDDGQVNVAVRYRQPTNVVLAGWMLPDVELQADASMRREAAP